MRRRLLVCLSRDEDPLLTLDAQDHAFVNWLSECFFPEKPPRGGHEVLYVNRCSDFEHYKCSADVVMLYYSNALRASTNFRVLHEKLFIDFIPTEHILALAMATHSRLCNSALTMLTDDLFQRIVGHGTVRPNRVSAFVEEFWNAVASTTNPTINTMSFLQDNVFQNTIFFQH